MAKNKTELEVAGEILNERQKLFCQKLFEYNFNGTRAAEAAGYSKHTANEQAAQLLAKLSVKNYIELLKRDLGERLGAGRERVAKELHRLSFFDARKMMNEDGSLKPLSELDDDTAACINSIEINQLGPISLLKKVKVSEKRAALEAYSKLMGYDAPIKTETTITSVREVFKFGDKEFEW